MPRSASTRLEAPATINVHGTSSGRRLRLEGRGLPESAEANRGLLRRGTDQVPTSLSGKALFEELAERSTFNPRERR